MLELNAEQVASIENDPVFPYYVEAIALQRKVKQEIGMSDKRPTVAELRDILNLEPHPTCGFTGVTYISPGTITTDALPTGYNEAHPFASAMYFLVTSESEIRLHALRSDQIYHHYLGDPLEVLLLYPDGSWAMPTVGSDILLGQRPQLLIPGGTQHISRVKGNGEYALLGTIEFPGFTPEDLILGDPAELAAQYPECAELLVAFTHASPP